MEAEALKGCNSRWIWEAEEVKDLLLTRITRCYQLLHGAEAP